MVKPIPIITGDISQINWTRLLLILVGFFVFSMVLAGLGISVAVWGVLKMLGAFIAVVAVGGIVTGKIPFNVFLVMFIVGLALVMIDPLSSFTIGSVTRGLGLSSIPLIAGGIVLFEGDDSHVG